MAAPKAQFKVYRIKVADGAKVQDPMTGKLLLVGEIRDVMSTAFWTRRIRDKSVVLVDEKGNPIRPKTAETAAPVPAKPRAAKPSTNKDD